MLDYFYDSLDTLKQLKKPTLKDFVQMTIAIFAIVIVGGIFFVSTDAIRWSVYQTFYQIFK
jgi:preprotein translocase subunit Sss1